MPDLTIAEVSAELRIRRDAVVRLLQSGAIVGYDAALPGARKRSYRIPREALDAFKSSRVVKAATVVRSRRRTTAVKEFF